MTRPPSSGDKTVRRGQRGTAPIAAEPCIRPARRSAYLCGLAGAIESKCALKLGGSDARADPPFCVAIGWRLAASRVAADPGYLRGVGIAAETGAAQGRQLGRLDRPGPGRRGKLWSSRPASVTTATRGPWSVRLPYLRSSRHGCSHRRFGASGTNRGQFLYFSATGVQGLVTTSPGGIRGPPRPLRRRRDLSPASSRRGRRESPAAPAAARGRGWVRRRRS